MPGCRTRAYPAFQSLNARIIASRAVGSMDSSLLPDRSDRLAHLFHVVRAVFALPHVAFESGLISRVSAPSR